VRLLTKDKNGHTHHQNFIATNWDYIEPEGYEEGKGYVHVMGLVGYEDQHSSFIVDPKAPPHDKSGIHSQRVFIMNDKGETIDQVFVNPLGGWECYQ